MKGICRAMTFIATGVYTALLINKPEASWVWIVLLGAVIGVCSGYGWEKD